MASQSILPMTPMRGIQTGRSCRRWSWRKISYGGNWAVQAVAKYSSPPVRSVCIAFFSVLRVALLIALFWMLSMRLAVARCSGRSPDEIRGGGFLLAMGLD